MAQLIGVIGQAVLALVGLVMILGLVMVLSWQARFIVRHFAALTEIGGPEDDDQPGELTRSRGASAGKPVR